MFNHHTLLSLFDTYISVLCYGCEIWGFHKAPDIEKVHVNYCKGILNVKTSTCTPNIMVYYELGRYPLIVTKKIRIFKFWLKWLNANNCILKGWYAFLYDMCLKNPNNMNNWVCNIGKELCNIGLIDLRNSQAMLSKNVIFLIKQRLLICQAGIWCSIKCFIEMLFVSVNCYKCVLKRIFMQTYTRIVQKMYN